MLANVFVGEAEIIVNACQLTQARKELLLNQPSSISHKNAENHIKVETVPKTPWPTPISRNSKKIIKEASKEIDNFTEKEKLAKAERKKNYEKLKPTEKGKKRVEKKKSKKAKSKRKLINNDDRNEIVIINEPQKDELNEKKSDSISNISEDSNDN